jgi:hypothetical protein
MGRYFARPCPRCNGYLGIVLREAERNASLCVLLFDPSRQIAKL